MLSYGAVEGVASLPYKQIFSRLIPDLNSDPLRLEEVFSILPDGRLSMHLSGPPEALDITIREQKVSTLVLAGETPQLEAETPDGRYHIEIGSFVHLDVTEFWLVHTDRANGKFKRAKLSTEWQSTWHSQPQVAVSPKGSFFLADDSGIIRLYNTTHLVETGTFQVAHPHTENEVIALAVSSDERLIAGLSSWKDLVLYNVPERKVDFVRQIRDGVGWYESAPASVLIVGDAEAIVTAGAIFDANGQNELSLNAFQFVPLKLA